VVLLPQDAPLPAPTPRLAATAVRPGTSDDELAAALTRVGAVLPDGLDTDWAPGGRALDAGLRQLCGLALVLLAAPDVVVLDEPTSALPADGAAAVERALGVALTGRAVVVVAHRLSTACAADRVVVLDAGRVVEDGPPGALLAAGGPFAALASAAR
jgi:ABC-type multidrug transport system fused ATPase/permease subunit